MNNGIAFGNRSNYGLGRFGGANRLTQTNFNMNRNVMGGLGGAQRNLSMANRQQWMRGNWNGGLGNRGFGYGRGYGGFRFRPGGFGFGLGGFGFPGLGFGYGLGLGYGLGWGLGGLG